MQKLSWDAPPLSDSLPQELKEFYTAVKRLFEAARRVDVGGLCEGTLEFQTPKPLLPVEIERAAAWRHLKGACERNSVAEMSGRVRAFVNCIREMRRKQGT